MRSPRWLTLCATAFALTTVPVAAQIRNPCNVITKAEAESLLGGPLIGPQPSPQGTLCKYYEDGYGETPARIKLVTIGVWIDAPDEEAVNTRRLAVMKDSSLLPLRVKELAGPGDAAIWVWAGNRLGALYTFRGGTVQVAVKISGTTEAAALAAARRFSVRAMGSAGRTTFAYAEPLVPIKYSEYYAPRLLSSLYLGVFNQVADDPMTRNYVLSLAQALNSECGGPPNNPIPLIEYGFWNEVKGQKDMFKSAWKGDGVKVFRDVAALMRRARPHLLELADSDAVRFLVSQRDSTDSPFDVEPYECKTAQTKRLFDNISALAEQRGRIPPDVPDDYSFLAQLSPDGQKFYGFNARAPRVLTGAQALKKACNVHNGTTGAQAEESTGEVYCRCAVDAALVGSLPETEMRALAAHFDDRTLKQTVDRNPSFAAYWRDCLH
jgi:hypothetical protein